MLSPTARKNDQQWPLCVGGTRVAGPLVDDLLGTR